jgi:CubicO group peptidase (beta-lactamase class C family)
MNFSSFARLLVVASSAPTVVFASPAAGASEQTQMSTVPRIEDYMQRRMPSLRTPGMAVVVVQGDDVLLSRGYGLADRDAGTPMTDDTPVPIASTNKGMTVLAVMQLVEQGLVDLDEPVVSYLPDFTMDDARVRDITLRQLLSHTAGIPGGWSIDLAQDEHALERKVESLATVALLRDPGSGYEYSNDGYSVAGLVVQTVSGMAYEDYLATHLFAPLEMTQSTFDLPLATEWGLTTVHTKRHGSVISGPAPLSRGNNPAGGLLTTARDAGKYLIALLNGGALDDAAVISQASLDQMWTPEPASGAEAYGLGWVVMNQSGLRLLLHAGDLSGTDTFGGSASQFVLVPDHRLAVGVLANMSSFEKAEVAQDIVAILMGGEPAARPAQPDWRQSTFVPNRDVWNAYVGEYQSVSGPLRIYCEGDRLLGLAQDISIEFVPQSDTTFIVLAVGALDEAPVEFVKHADGRVTLVFSGRPLGSKK